MHSSTDVARYSWNAVLRSASISHRSQKRRIKIAASLEERRTEKYRLLKEKVVRRCDVSRGTFCSAISFIKLFLLHSRYISFILTAIFALNYADT